MENSVEIFKNEQFGEIRTIEVESKIYFCGSDIAKALGYARPSDAISAHCRYTVKRSIPHPQSPDKEIEMSFIPEGDVYRLITHSKLPAAEEFEKWLFDEVVPTIREHGVYMTPAAIKKTLADPDYIIQLATMWKEAEEKAVVLAAENQVMKPKAEYFDCLVDRNLLTGIRDTAKEFGIKQNVFVNYLLDNKYLYRNQKGKLTPYAQYVDDGMFTLKEFANKKNGFADTQTLITPKGKETLRLFLQVNPVPTENE